jgi:hypothetical protein
MFKFLENVAKAAVAVAVTPVAVVADAATMGGFLTDRNESYTGEKLRQAAQSLNRAIED